ncbi:DNA repair exonuclease SbcCD ATPase subunit [Pseudomonas lurida]
MSTNPKKAPAQESLEMSGAEDAQKAVAPASAVTDIAEYRPHEEQIVRLETTYAKLVVDCSTSEGLASAKEVRVDIRDVRYALDKTTKTALVPYQQKVKEAQARVNQVKEFGETLKSRVLAIEEPVDEAIKAEEKRIADAKAERERVEAERVEAIRAKITRFSSVAAAYASRSAADVAGILQGVKESVILPEEYGEFEAEGTIARDNAIEQLEALHKAAIDREEAAAKLLAQQKELDELREKQRIADAEAEELRKQRAEEDRLRLKKQQDELDQQRRDMEAQQRQQRERDAQYQRDQEELARLRAQAAAPAPAVTVVAAPVIADPAQTVVAAIDPAPAADAFADSNIPSASEVVEVVAMAFCVTNDEASVWLRAMSF